MADCKEEKNYDSPGEMNKMKNTTTNIEKLSVIYSVLENSVLIFTM